MAYIQREKMKTEHALCNVTSLL